MKTRDAKILVEKLDEDQDLCIVFVAKNEKNMEQLLQTMKKFGYNCFLRATSLGQEVVITGKNIHVIEQQV